MNIYQSNAHRKDLSWLHFDNESRFQEMHQVKDQQSCIIAFLITYGVRIDVSQNNLPHLSFESKKKCPEGSLNP